MSTTFTTISDEEVVAEWPDSWRRLETRVDGDLAEKVRAKVGATSDAEVVITEHAADGGWSEYTTEWNVDFTVTVAGKRVWLADYEWQESFSGGAPVHEPGNALSKFVAWVDAPATQ